MSTTGYLNFTQYITGKLNNKTDVSTSMSFKYVRPDGKQSDACRREEQYDYHRPLAHFVRPDSTLTMADRYLPAAVSQWNDAPPQQLPRESRGRAPPGVITGRSRHAPQQPVAGERSLSGDRELRCVR